jgi:hypothetical protein
MLPGFRFLFTAVVLSMSILVFGLGAAALLRASHEKFASFPSLRPPPEPTFTRQDDPVPTLALMRVDPAEVAKKVDDVPPAATPEIAPDILEPVEQASEANPAVPETLAAVKPEEPILVEAPTPEIPPTEAIAKTPADPTETEAPVAEPEAPLEAIAETPAASPETGAPAADEEAKLAATAETPEPPAENAPPLAEPATNAISLESNIAATTIATPGGRAGVVDEKTSAKTTGAKPDRSAVKKRIAQRARERRRIAQRAQLEREAALAAQQRQADPFGLLTPFAPRTR